MNQHLGASCLMSVLLLVVFAVAFYRPEPRSGAPRPGRPHANPLTGQVSVGTPVGSASPPEAIAGRRVEPGRADGVSPPTQPASAGRAEAAAVPFARRVSRPEAAKRVVPAPRRAFATVGPGETLADVAARVYGPSGSAEALRRANRDQLPSAGTPVREGTVLRTP